MTLPPNRTARCLLLISEWRLRRWQRWLRANRKLGVAGDSQREQDRATQTFHSLLPGWIVRNCLCLVTLLFAPLPCGYAEQHLTQWHALPKDFQVATRSETSATLQRSNAWAYLQSPDDYANVEVSALVTIESPATQLEFFGSTWSAWPDPKFEDRGFEAGLLVRGAEDGSSGYRVQVSSKYREIALVRFPDGGYVRSVPCDIQMQTPISLRVQAAGNIIRVFVNSKEVIHYVDCLAPIPASGRIAIGASSGAKIRIADVAIKGIDAEQGSVSTPHPLQLSARRWLGERIWIFDHDEPILQLHCEKDPSMFAKLRPGLKPLLTFDSHWGLENQGAFKEAMSTWSDPEVTGSNEQLQVAWSARHVLDRFTTSSKLRVGYDARRNTYTYDIESTLEMLPGEPFAFRYGFDFEHHTPLDPFRWQYLLIRNRRGAMVYRPLSPFDPGPLGDIEADQGLRVWHGRTGDVHRVSPAVEYSMTSESSDAGSPTIQKLYDNLNGSVCAAFYDTGVAFEQATLQPGEKISVRYRYTGYPESESSELFQSATVQDNPRIDPKHHFVFARDQWPTIRFGDAIAMDHPWWIDVGCVDQACRRDGQERASRKRGHPWIWSATIHPRTYGPNLSLCVIGPYQRDRSDRKPAHDRSRSMDTRRDGLRAGRSAMAGSHSCRRPAGRRRQSGESCP